MPASDIVDTKSAWLTLYLSPFPHFLSSSAHGRCKILKVFNMFNVTRKEQGNFFAIPTGRDHLKTS